MTNRGADLLYSFEERLYRNCESDFSAIGSFIIVRVYTLFIREISDHGDYFALCMVLCLTILVL